MKRILLILLVGFSTTNLFAQCTMQESGKHVERNDQYAKSSKQCIKSSENAMDKQESQFQKPRYSSEVKPAGSKKRTDRSQY